MNTSIKSYWFSLVLRHVSTGGSVCCSCGAVIYMCITCDHHYSCITLVLGGGSQRDGQNMCGSRGKTISAATNNTL